MYPAKGLDSDWTTRWAKGRNCPLAPEVKKISHAARNVFCVSFIVPPVYYRLYVHLTLYPTLKLHDLRSDIPLNILTSDVLVPVYRAYENLVVSSVGLKRFNRLGSSSSVRAGMSSLGCVMSFSRCLVLKFSYFCFDCGYL